MDRDIERDGRTYCYCGEGKSRKKMRSERKTMVMRWDRKDF